MASIEKHKDGYRAQVYVAGSRESKKFRTLREANAWASMRETELRSDANKSPKDKHTLRELLEKYRDEVSPTKRGELWEVVRIDKFLRSKHLPIDKPLSSCTSEALGIWRDNQKISAGSIIREFGLLSAVFEFARRELKWIDINPSKDVRKPKSPEHRNVTITRKQIKLILKSFGYSPQLRISTISHSVAVMFLLALRTGMRSGELCNLTWNNIHDNYCFVPVTKTVPRNVPLSKKAVKLLNRMKGFDTTSVFSVSAATRDALFRRARDKASLDGFTWHDARHTAATWISRKVDVLTLCKIFGWSDTSMALTYYNPKAKDISVMLD
jgi:integrase